MQRHNRKHFFNRIWIVETGPQMAVAFLTGACSVLGLLTPLLLDGVESLFHDYMPSLYPGGEVIFFSVALIPFLAITLLSFYVTNKIVGPIYRLRAHMNAVARGETREAIKFRKYDFFQDVADAFNLILKELPAQSKPESQKTKSVS